MSTERQREQVRRRVAKHRAKHRLRDSLRAEQRTPMRTHGRKPTWRVVELIGPDSVPTDVVVVRADETIDVPEGCRVSTAWLPAGTMGERAARRLRRFRLAQIKRWCGGHPAAGGETPDA